METTKSIEIKLKENLKESCNLIYEFANNHCKNGDGDDNCVWYHSIWQYYRMLNVVASPTWHNEFYITQFSKAFNKDNSNILISGAADYAILAYVLEIMKQNKVKLNIYVLDMCETPLFACKWYANKENVNIKCVNEDILNYNNDEFFDVICTDAFLTRFNDNDSNLVIDKWYKLLKKEGKIITTVRIHDSDTKNTPNAMEKYIQKIKKEYNKYEKYIGISCDKLMEKTEEWLNKKKSNNIGDKEKILNKFKKFDVEYNVRKVSGELSETEYIELVATKN